MTCDATTINLHGLQRPWGLHEPRGAVANVVEGITFSASSSDSSGLSTMMPLWTPIVPSRSFSPLTSPSSTAPTQKDCNGNYDMGFRFGLLLFLGS
ncbi:hypothetical protein GYH30_023393 [Glycine max]|uniref:Uncharacterized protein n=1 Tax=Glycine soja TaxID=3848 RepID=A0A0B2PT89_GLYSO|nr:hypothetical protein GYH30_023393 [Glycine max]KHN10988.1 hypothetical protein glysoja_026723 [Glycine soja]